MALVQDDIKRLLAYSSISQMGYILLGFGIGLQYSLILGVLGGVPPTAANLLAMVEQLPPRSDWEVIGIGRDQWRLAAAACAIGGNVRVGLEDNFYLPDGTMARSNGELVERAARMIRAQGRAVASVEECRRRLELRHR
mgnify:CR=1 FL=1